jgi:FkbM family methyltransferase
MLKKLTRRLPSPLALLSFDRAMSLSKRLMKSQGFGAGSSSRTSGESGVFQLVQGDAPVLFDVGGHVGDYTAAFLAAHPSGRAFVFEPSATHFKLLRDRIGNIANVTLQNCALGAQRSELPLYKNADVTGLASLAQRRLDHIGIAMDKVEMVQVETLDDVCGGLGVQHIDLLKIDVEGHEMDVLKGAARMFAERRVDSVQFEFGGCNLDTKTTLQDFYYFFKEVQFSIGVVQPSGRVQPLGTYDEFYEHYRTTNFLAQRTGM